MSPKPIFTEKRTRESLSWTRLQNGGSVLPAVGGSSGWGSSRAPGGFRILGCSPRPQRLVGSRRSPQLAAEAGSRCLGCGWPSPPACSLIGGRAQAELPASRSGEGNASMSLNEVTHSTGRPLPSANPCVWITSPPVTACNDSVPSHRLTNFVNPRSEHFQKVLK